MIMKPIRLHWQLIDPITNKARWYSLTISKDLWGNMVLIKRWGRINRIGQQQFEWFDDEESLLRTIQTTHQRRIQHQYQFVENQALTGEFK